MNMGIHINLDCWLRHREEGGLSYSTMLQMLWQILCIAVRPSVTWWPLQLWDCDLQNQLVQPACGLIPHTIWGYKLWTRWLLRQYFCLSLLRACCTFSGPKGGFPSPLLDSGHTWGVASMSSRMIRNIESHDMGEPQSFQVRANPGASSDALNVSVMWYQVFRCDFV